MPDYSGYPMCFIYLRLKVVNDGQQDKLAINFSTVAHAVDPTTPVVSMYTGNQDITLPVGDGRPYAFALAYDMGDALNPTQPDGNAKYTWGNDPLQNLVIWEDGLPQPAWGTALPHDFIDAKFGGGLLTFIDSNGSDGKSYNYCVRLNVASAPGTYLSPLDPRITNSGRG